MPGTTPVYGFPYPEPTDLVADYPALGQQLAEDIEAVLPDLGGLIASPPTTIANSGGTATLSGNTVTFTTVNSVSLNGCFTATYSDYMLRMTITAVSGTNMAIYARLRASGTDSTGSYRQETIEHYSTTVGAGQNWASNGGTQWTLAQSTTTNATYTGAAFDILSPQKAAYTNAYGSAGWWNSSSVSIGHLHRAFHGVASAYDGISIIASTGTISGTVAVYGLKK